MTGREEMELKFNKSIKTALSTAPQIVSDFCADLGDMTPTSKNAYVRNVIDYITFCDRNNINIYKAKRTDINRYMEHIETRKDGGKMSVPARKVCLASVRKFYGFLEEEEAVAKNPATNVATPKEQNEKEVVYMTPEEVSYLKLNITKSNQPDRLIARDLAIITIGCQTGLRISALMNINVADIDFDNNSLVTVEKGNKRRNLYLAEKTIEVIRDWLSYRNKIVQENNIDTDALFISTKFTRLSPRQVRRLMQRYTEGMNKHITPHKMRSTCGTNIYLETGDIYLAKDVLGHKNVETTQRYVANTSRKIKDVAEKLSSIY